MFTVSTLGQNGRLGNSLFQYCFSKAISRRFNTELIVPKNWIGHQLFDIEDKLSDNNIECLPRTQFDEIPEKDNLDIYGYWQFDQALIYTREDVVKWLKFKPEILKTWKKPYSEYVAIHQRLGDYLSPTNINLYAVPNTMSYYKAIEKANISTKTKVLWISDGLDGSNDINWIQNFLELAFCDVLIRANSTFSWWSGVIGNQKKKIFSPLVGDLTGWCHVEFVEGNYPAMASAKIHGTRLTDLHLKGME